MSATNSPAQVSTRLAAMRMPWCSRARATSASLAPVKVDSTAPVGVMEPLAGSIATARCAPPRILMPKGTGMVMT